MDTNATRPCCSLVQAPGHSLRLQRAAPRIARFVCALCISKVAGTFHVPWPAPIARFVCALGIGALLAISGGCSALQGVRDYAHYNDVTDDFVIGWRNYVWANKAWHEEKPCFAGHPQLHDFGEGFRAGYRDVAAGSNGCPPPLPPRKYWSWKYQHPEGQAKIAAWFSGYPHGAAAAEQAGAGNWREIPVSHVIQQQYSPEFERGMIPRCDGSYYPQPTDVWVTDPHGPPGQTQPVPYGVPADVNPPLVPGAPQGDLPGFEQGSMRAAPSTVLPVAAYRQNGEWGGSQWFNESAAGQAGPGVSQPYPAWELFDSPPLQPQVVRQGSAGV